MKRRDFIRNSAMAAIVLSYYGCDVNTGYTKIILKAGNNPDHVDRFIMLSGLKDSGKVPEEQRDDLEIVLGFAQTWAYNSDSAEKIENDKWRELYLNRYYSDKIRQQTLNPERIDEVSESSPLYPLYCLYAGLALIHHTIEISNIRQVPELRDKWFGTGRMLLDTARKAYPDNYTIGIYFNEPVAWPSPVQAVQSAPEWANVQREALMKLREIIYWWIDNRQLKDGTYGGGLNDDCEMWRWWKAVLLGFEDKRAVKAQELLTHVTLNRPVMELGYTSRLTDVEHSSEETSDVITPMMHLFPEKQEWADYVLNIFALVKNKWTGRNERGFTQFKSSYFSSTEMDMAPHRACDTGYHFRLMQPIFLYWQRTGHKEIGEWVLAWLDTWLDASLSTVKGKPEGIIPSAIHWPDGNPGGTLDEWWTPGNYSSPIYDWPSQTVNIHAMLVMAYHMSGDEKYLEPLFKSAQIRLDHIEKYGNEHREWKAGSIEWIAERLGGVISVALMKYRIISDDTRFDDLIGMDANGYLKTLMSGDGRSFHKEINELSEAYRYNKVVYTSEVRNTDRVMAFPSNYLDAFYKTTSGSQLAGLLFQSVTGDPGYRSYFPLEALSWEAEVGDVSSYVLKNSWDQLVFMVFNFTGESKIHIRTKLLKKGKYNLTISEAGSSEMRISEVNIAEANSRVELLLDSGKELKVELKRI